VLFDRTNAVVKIYKVPVSEMVGSLVQNYDSFENVTDQFVIGYQTDNSISIPFKTLLNSRDNYVVVVNTKVAENSSIASIRSALGGRYEGLYYDYSNVFYGNSGEAVTEEGRVSMSASTSASTSASMSASTSASTSASMSTSTSASTSASMSASTSASTSVSTSAS
ncbi:accessory Sec-dependent LPXTG-anchored adhesin, partial [Streptococcus agalactiae]|nr:accessory Sec-dependent LPXTG-anchored adhesin [Streptococcus agalactiae]